MLNWIQKRSGLSIRRKKYTHSRTDSSVSNASTCTTSSIDSRSTACTRLTVNMDISEEATWYKDASPAPSWDSGVQETLSRSPSAESFKRSDSLLSFECVGDEAVATAKTATFVRCNARNSVRIIDRTSRPLKKAKSTATLGRGDAQEIRPLPTPGTTRGGCRSRTVPQDRLNPWEQAGSRDGLCPIGPFAPHPANTCHYLHLPLPPIAAHGSDIGIAH